MIIEKLSKIKLEAENKIKSEYRKIETVKNFKKLLNQIDFTAEVVPTEDSKRLTKVLTSLKGKALNRSESKLVVEIADKSLFKNKN